MTEDGVWEGAWQIVGRLRAAGHAAYVVGGAVRDRMLGLSVDEVDIATSATPSEVLALFPEAVPTGAAYGTVTVLWGGKAYEVTTFRREVYPTADRHPVVVFGTSLEADLARRDFTINAMAMGPDGEVVDPFGGREDLRRGVVRAVGNPEERFREDPLRMVRAVRFAARFAFAVEERTWEALVLLRLELVRVARERILAEIEKLFRREGIGRGLALFDAAGLLAVVRAQLRAVAERLFPRLSPDLPRAVLVWVWEKFLGDPPGYPEGFFRLPWPRRVRRAVASLEADLAELSASPPLAGLPWPLVRAWAEGDEERAATLFSLLALLREAGAERDLVSLPQEALPLPERWADVRAHLGALPVPTYRDFPLELGEFLTRYGLRPGPWVRELRESLYRGVNAGRFPPDPAALEAEALRLAAHLGGQEKRG
ncbi:CCA tRNA nucleotidyltransferase [Brockia lithotrophica]|uniref:tRNA nucleotidyltransferase (CCA-adding enzyme) n=1 Tax=Brockia lithotrophica TaxID=933949 RepID=A0A660L821_9BACL|nr:hypothetical protein [Brockia lithotrophica]RKQ89009.1 tRNA nucleotidyltransferase (CCA-adding enzyme) [Brockia lithotrophica]